jgi:hypothetical protein
LRGRVRDWPRLQQQIRLGEYVLIVIDPVYKLLLLVGESIRDENRTGGVATVLDQMDALTERTGAAIAFGAHFSKGDQAKKESIDRVSGTGVWARDPDAIINFTALSTDDSYAVDMDLRSYPPQKPFALRWEYPEFIRADELDPTQLKKRKPSGAAEKQYDVQELVALLEEPMRAGEYQELAKEEIGMKERTFYSLFAEAKENGLIIADKDRKWQRNPNPPNPE